MGITVANAGLEAALRRPMLLIGGWYDPYLRGTMALHDQSLKAGGCPRLVVGPWTHGNWHGGQLDQRHLAFFNQHLKDDPPEQPQHPVQLFDVGRGHWWRGSRWPRQAVGRCWLRGAGLSGMDPHAGLLLLGASPDRCDRCCHRSRGLGPAGAGSMATHPAGAGIWTCKPAPRTAMTWMAAVTCSPSPPRPVPHPDPQRRRPVAVEGRQ